MRKNPDETVFVLIAAASHGMSFNGAQALLVNELNNATGFYKVFAAEEDCRDIAKNHSNSYLLGLFACCREIFN